MVNKSFKSIVRITNPTIAIRDYKSRIESDQMALFCEASTLRSFILWLLAIIHHIIKKETLIENELINY